MVAVIGASVCDEETRALAFEVGAALARAGFVVVTGGLGGVMAAASAGAQSCGGLVIGILPGADPAAANPHVSVAMATGMGDARNAIIANTADGFIALPGSFGTLSEIAYARKRNKPVVSLGSWSVDPAIAVAAGAKEAVDLLVGMLGVGG